MAGTLATDLLLFPGRFMASSLAQRMEVARVTSSSSFTRICSLSSLRHTYRPTGGEVSALDRSEATSSTFARLAINHHAAGAPSCMGDAPFGDEKTVCLSHFGVKTDCPMSLRALRVPSS